MRNPVATALPTGNEKKAECRIRQEQYNSPSNPNTLTHK